MTKKQRGPASDALHAGYGPLPTDMTLFRSFVPPIVQSAIYPLDDVDQYTRISQGLEPGYHYGRTMNPTVDVLQQRLAALEGYPVDQGRWVRQGLVASVASTLGLVGVSWGA